MLGIDRRRGMHRTAPAGGDCYTCFTSEQVLECAAIAGAVADGNDRYLQALYDVSEFLATAAAESVGAPVVATSAERWARVAAWPWPRR
ncbi:MAG TPA: hypothetical protein VGP02_04135 [Mycobacteriales bacterium]|jgi:hypothetical protein|nr:hypothetical protein [Mycobacteriales bacterium]